eukprot:9076628-Lingulodinium_polyedra.AAC.1
MLGERKRTERPLTGRYGAGAGRNGARQNTRRRDGGGQDTPNRQRQAQLHRGLDCTAGWAP